MKTSADPRRPLLGIALLLTLLVGLACGGGDGDGTASPTSSPTESPTTSPTASPLPGATSGPLFDYLTSFIQIVDDADAGTVAAVERFNEDSLGAISDEAVVVVMQAYLSDIETAFTDAIDRFEALSVPDVAVVHHETFIEGFSSSVSAASSLRLELPDVTSRAELDERLAQFGTEIEAAVGISNPACLELQKIADTEDIAVDLDC